MRQSELARQVGISASYLNLIEHNRRRIGGKLLVDIASVLMVEPSVLTQGIEATLISALREAAAESVGHSAEIDGLEEFAGRFPGWAKVLAQMHRRVVSLERTVETLSDRLTHDPHLAASMHEVLSTAAAIRSTAAILVDTRDIEAEWQDRFHRNLHQDAERLADSSKALVAYLDDNDSVNDRRGVPLEEAEAFFSDHAHHFPMIEENGATGEIDLNALDSGAARAVTRDLLGLYARDAQALPLEPLKAALADTGTDPLKLAARFSVDLATVLRRLAFLPKDTLTRPTGLVICDASGSILFFKPVQGFALPRYGEACPLWPLYQALNRPLVPIRRRVLQLGRTAAEFECHAVAWPHSISGHEDGPDYRSVMLVQPVEFAGDTSNASVRAGPGCRVCPNPECGSRREPSILSEGF